jgi:glycosyltransferase involved in cell wall biosynthesis
MLRNKCDFEPTHVIHHGVDLELFNPLTYSKKQARRLLGLPEDKKIILWNARLSPEKKIETLLYAIPKVLKSYKNLMVLVKTRAVDKAYKMKVKKLVKKLNLDKHVLFEESWTPLTKLSQYYRAADVYVNTSTSEAFGSLTMLEAMACGVPTIANNASSNPEALGDGGLLYDRNNAVDLAEKLLKVLTDEKYAELIGYKAFKRVLDELALHNIARKYLSVYSSL